MEETAGRAGLVAGQPRYCDPAAALARYVTVGVQPRGAQVRAFGGRRFWPASSSKHTYAPVAAASLAPSPRSARARRQTAPPAPLDASAASPPARQRRRHSGQATTIWMPHNPRLARHPLRPRWRAARDQADRPPPFSPCSLRPRRTWPRRHQEPAAHGLPWANGCPLASNRLTPVSSHPGGTTIATYARPANRTGTIRCLVPLDTLAWR